MSDPTPSTTATPHVDESLVAYTHVIYALHAFAVLIGLTTAHTIVGSFIGGLPSIVAVIMNYARRSATRGTYLESHFRWQNRLSSGARLARAARPASDVRMRRTGLGRARLGRALCAVAAAAALTVLAGCGQKGALYLPDKNAAVVTSAPPSAESSPAQPPTSQPPAPQPPATRPQAAPTPPGTPSTPTGEAPRAPAESPPAPPKKDKSEGDSVAPQ